MRKLVRCYIKQKQRTCPYEKLIQIEGEISYLKRARHYLKKQYEELIKQVELMQLAPFNSTKKDYLDGFCWDNHAKDLERTTHLKDLSHDIEVYKKNCIFGKQDCQLQLLARKSMRRFLSEQLLLETQSYNTILAICKELSAYHYKVGSPSHAFIRFLVQKERCKAFYYEGNTQHTIIYLEKKIQDRECHKQTLHFKIQEDSRVLTATCLLNLGKRPISIELCQLLQWVEEGVSFKLNSLYDLLGQLNATQSMSTSVYGKLENLSDVEKSVCINYFRNQGFRVLGTFKENGQFEPECFIHLFIY